MTDLKSTLEARLATEDYVPVTYRKDDGTVKAYLLTKLQSPSYKAKTDRVKVATPAHLIQAFDKTSERFVSLKVANIL